MNSANKHTGEPEIAKADNPVWHRWQYVFATLTPIAVLIAGIAINWAISSAEEDRAAQQDKLARYALIPDFIDALSGDEKKKQILAIRTIYQVLPEEEAKNLLEGVIGDNSGEEDSVGETSAPIGVSNPVTSAATALFSDEKSDREAAYELLRRGGYDNADVAEALTGQIGRDTQNLNGVFNAMKILSYMSKSDLHNIEPDLRALLPIVSENRPKTKAFADAIKATLDS